MSSPDAATRYATWQQEGAYAHSFLPLVPGAVSCFTCGYPENVPHHRITWNVAATVVDLIEATTADTAIGILVTRLREAGFELYEGTPPDAFESER